MPLFDTSRCDNPSIPVDLFQFAPIDTPIKPTPAPIPNDCPAPEIPPDLATVTADACDVMASASASPLDSDEPPRVDVTTMTMTDSLGCQTLYNFHFYIPRGEQGPTGAAGPTWPPGGGSTTFSFFSYRSKCVNNYIQQYKQQNGLTLSDTGPATTQGPWIFDRLLGCCECLPSSSDSCVPLSLCDPTFTVPCTLHLVFEFHYRNTSCIGPPYEPIGEDTDVTWETNAHFTHITGDAAYWAIDGAPHPMFLEPGTVDPGSPNYPLPEVSTQVVFECPDPDTPCWWLAGAGDMATITTDQTCDSTCPCLTVISNNPLHLELASIPTRAWAVEGIGDDPATCWTGELSVVITKG